MFYITFITCLSLDIISKYLASIYLKSEILLVGDFFYLQLTHNPGIAFGIKVPFWLLKIGTIALIIGIYHYYRIELNKEENIKSKKILHISFGLILSGAVGNAIERVLHERVVDFIGIKYFSIFNLADTFISIGAILLLYYYYNQSKLCQTSDQEN